MNEDEQAVVEPTNVVEEVPAAPVDSAQDELDSLLSEYSSEPEQPAPIATEPVETADKLDEVHSYIQGVQRQDAERVTNERIENSVKMFNESLEVPLSDEMAKTLLHGMAATDPRILKAFTNASNNPEGWNKVVKGMAQNYAKSMAQTPNADATADQDAVVAAVQSATTKAPQQVELSDEKIHTMSARDFNTLQQKMGIPM